MNNNNPFLQNRSSQLSYFSIWAIVIIAQMLLLFYKTELPLPYLIADSVLSNLLLMAYLLILWYPIRFYKTIVNFPLFLLFHFLLLSLCLLICKGGTVIVMDILFPNDFQSKAIALDLIPFGIVVNILLYVIAVVSYYLIQSVHEIKGQNRTIEESAEPKETLTRISVKKNKEVLSIPVESICYIEANGDYVLIYTTKGRFLKDRTMKYFETHLPSGQFVRIHRSFIINLDYMTKLELYQKDLYQVQMKDSVLLKVSTAGYKLLKHKMG